MKLYKVKSRGPVTHGTSGNSKDLFWRDYRDFFHSAGMSDMYSATGAQMGSSSVQKAHTSSSSAVSLTKLPVKHEASEKIHIKQVFGSDEKTSGEYVFFVYLPPL